MAIQRIRQLGDPVLRERSRELRDFREAHPVLADLADTLHEFQRTHGFGRGISAVQIGAPVRVIYLEFGGIAYSLINPELTEMSAETFELWDDCFSFPHLMVRVARSAEVEIGYLNERGERCTLRCREALSELVQHEMDHLEGVLAIDRALDRDSFATREEWLRHSGTGPSEML